MLGVAVEGTCDVHVALAQVYCRRYVVVEHKLKCGWVSKKKKVVNKVKISGFCVYFKHENVS